MPLKTAFQFVSDALPDLPSEGAAQRDSGAPIRQQKRAAAWRQQITRAYAYQASRARSQSELDALERDYERALEDKPDFARVHRDSDFAAPPIKAYDRNEAHRIMTQARGIERGTYEHREKGQHGGVLGKSAIRVLEVMLFVLWPIAKRGMFPSLAHIAAKAQLSVRTVQTSLAVLRLLGFLTILRRVKRVQTALGLMQQQDTNAYLVHIPKGLGAIGAALFSWVLPDGKKFQAKETIFNLTGFSPANLEKEAAFGSYGASQINFSGAGGAAPNDAPRARPSGFGSPRP